MTADDRAELVADFQRIFETPMTPEFWLKLMQEEVSEVEKAVADLLKEISDFGYVLLGFQNCYPDGEEVILSKELGDALDDCIDRFNYTTTVAGQFEPVLDRAFARVHASNMSKLDANGKVTRREDGKVLKGLNYKPAELLDLVRMPG
jgi:predicted HAD superfamily Cof-like phosphohydrolase